MSYFSQKPEAGMPQHAQFMPQHAKIVEKPDFEVMPQHDEDNQTRLFLASRVWDSYVILLSLLI